MKLILQDNIERITEVCKTYHVRSLFAFGSVCTDKFSESSDVDLLIDFYPMDYGDYADNYFVVADKMEEIFQRDVDLITEKSLSNPHFIESINRTKVKLYG